MNSLTGKLSMKDRSSGYAAILGGRNEDMDF